MEECDALLAVPAKAESDIGDSVGLKAKADFGQSKAVPSNSIVGNRTASSTSLAPSQVCPCSSWSSLRHETPSRAVSGLSTKQLDLLCCIASALL